jgi:putative ABC transport system permease protein
MSRWLAAWRVALRSLVRRDREEQELQEEFQYHLQRQIEDGLQAGLTPDEARVAALRAMGAIERSKEECRDMRTGNLIADFVGDLRTPAARCARIAGSPRWRFSSWRSASAPTPRSSVW